MPTTYAHDRFGEEVLKRLSEKERRLVERHKNLYSIGLHGPDIFFYYNPMFGENVVIKKGNAMHEENAASFFIPSLEIVQKNRSEAALVYLLGFTCHFILDSCCHPYINQAQRLPGCTHGAIECELDRYYLELDRRDPFSYLSAGHLNDKDPEIREIAPLFPEFSEKQIRKSIAGLRNYTNFLVCQTNFKEDAILGALKLVGAYDSFESHVLREYPVEACAACVPNILPLYEKALQEAPAYLHEVCQAALGKAELSGRFERNFE